MPSGILWSVTASTIIVVLVSLLFGPSGLSLNRCRCGITSSSTMRNSVPSIKPTAAGTKDHFPSPLLCCIAGISRLQIDAATITPAAKPVRIFSIFTFS